MDSDPFGPDEWQIQATYETLKVFHQYRYPIILFTKSDMVADDRYIKLYRPETTYIQMTVTRVGIISTAVMNCRTVRPFETLAINIPTNGDQEIHQAHAALT